MGILSRIALALPAGYLIASAGVWYQQPTLITRPQAIYQAWTALGLQAPNSMWLAAYAAAFAVALLLVHPSLERSKYGKAKWGTWRTALELKLNGTSGIFLGLLDGKSLRLDESLSVLILAPPGTGKTSAIAIPTLLTSRNSFIISDLKGELFDLTAPTRSTFSRVWYFNPTNKNTARFNIFAANMMPKSILDYSGHVLNAAHIIIEAPQKGEDYFTKAARDAFAFFAQWLIWKNGETSLPEIRSKILSSEDIAWTVEEMIADLEGEGALSSHNDWEEFGAGIIQKLVEDGRSTLVAARSEEQWAGVMGTLSTALQPFSDPRIAAATSGPSDLNALDLKKECTSIYLVIPDKDLARLSPIVTLIFEALGSQLISELPKPGQIPVTFLLDEFIRLGKLKQVKELPAISRGYRVNAVFIAQDFQQIADKYGREAVSIFNSTCAYKVIFRQNDLKTAKDISDTIGNFTTTKLSTSRSAKGVLKTDKSTSESEEGLALVSAQEILNLSKEESIVIGQGELMHPLKVQNGFWFNLPVFENQVKQNAHRADVL
ncbi:MAG: type IV secretory system conjugative DNA transfer family protein [Blastochloris viridis]|uniref:Type IV secretory system conjugative DNA transfer family protein n=1 Tax=Blastochloris viridis TaxID=1079 RepID=A0A6N4RCX3_BLAVI|nr:MAG: type IV secretory system conjugative DNA transfer family protein [Blastochloris viridis]